jgi:cell division septal protein FtsQ
VVVEVKIPARVQVIIVEREPVLTWKQDGRNFWVAADGVAYPERSAKAPRIVVEAEGALPAPAVSEASEASDIRVVPQIPAELVKAVLAMAAEAPKDTPLVYSAQRGLGWKDPRGWQVFFGYDTADMETKLNVYKAIVRQLKQDDIQPALISVEYTDAPYYRLEQ